MRIFSLLAASVLAASCLVGCNKEDSAPAAGGGAKPAAGAPDSRYIDTGCHMATKANMDTQEIKDLLYPPLDKYLSAAESGGGAGATTVKIAVIPKATTDEFWKSIHAGAVKAQTEANSKGAHVEIAWQGPVVENDSSKQISVVENMINTGVQAIVLAPNDTNALAEVVDTANSKKIPVVIIDSAVKTDNYKAFIATDNLKGGQIAGEEMVKLLGGKGRVIVLRHDKGQLSTEQREKGFIDAATKGGLTIVSSDQYGGPTGDTSLKAAENLLAGFKNPDNSLKADGIFASNEGATYGMLRALQELKQTGKVKFIGFDASQALVTALKDGEIDGLVVQDPVNMGYLGVKTALEILNGKGPGAK